MKIRPFAVEEWMNTYEMGASFNIAETCVDSVSMDELFSLTDTDPQEFWQSFGSRRLTYGWIQGRPGLREGICGLYENLQPDELVLTHGASGANHHLFYTLLEPGDRVVCVTPTYQQLYSIPESYGADVKLLPLREENGFLPDPAELEKLVSAETKVICLNNPNNPTGALMSRELMEQIVDMARRADAYLLCDEVYRHLTQRDEYSVSVVDLYEKGISVGSMSKVFSLAGLRLGWIAAHDRELLRDCFSHRDYTLISCGMFDEAAAELALRHADRLLARNRAIVRENLSVLDCWAEAEARVRYVRPQAGTTALVFYDLPYDSYTFCEKLYRETGTLVTPGDCFGQPRSMRIGYACDRDELRQGLAALSRFLHGAGEAQHEAE